MPFNFRRNLDANLFYNRGLKQNSLRKLTDQALAVLENIQIAEILPNEFNPHPLA